MRTLKQFVLVDLILLCVLVACSCGTSDGTPSPSILAVHDSDLPAVLRQCHAQFHTLKQQYNLDSYREHIMEQGSGFENTYRYDLGTRWFFVRVHEVDGHILEMFFVQKNSG